MIATQGQTRLRSCLAWLASVPGLLVLPFLLSACEETIAGSPSIVSFGTADGGNIEAAFFEAPGERAAIFAHGAVFNKESWFDQAQAVQAAGVSALSIDFRGFGNSTAGTTSNKHEDILGAIAFLKGEGYTHIGLVGASMGGKATLEALSHASDEAVDRVILMAPAGGDAVASADIAKLYVVSEGDGFFARTNQLFDASPEPKEIEIYSGSAHAQHLFQTEHAQALTNLIVDFLSREDEQAQVSSVVPPDGMVLIPGGEFLMGGHDGYPNETPVHRVWLSPFYMDRHEVTNQQFAEFVVATGYVTDAERWAWSLVFDLDAEDVTRVPGLPWWVKTEGSTWYQPEGPDSSIEDRGDFPVVQVSWNDAVAYCKWANKRLPTEAEYEFAARGGLEEKKFGWGDELAPGGKYLANTWTGTFPETNTAADGYAAVAPVESFPSNNYGLYDIIGNLWEWCNDWYRADYYRRSPAIDPQGPATGIEKIQRGGSWLCASNLCRGYRVSHRNKSEVDSGLSNTGFRCARSVSNASMPPKAGQ